MVSPLPQYHWLNNLLLHLLEMTLEIVALFLTFLFGPQGGPMLSGSVPRYLNHLSFVLHFHIP